MPLRAILIRVMLFSLGATAVGGAITVLALGMGDSGWRLVGTGISTAVAAGLMIPFSMLADKQKSRREGLLGMTLIVIEFVGAVGLIWNIFDVMAPSGHGEERIAMTLLFLALTGLPAILFLRFSTIPPSHVMGIAGVSLSGIVFALLLIGTWSDLRWDNHEWFSSAVAFSSLGLAGVAALAGIGTAPRRWWRWIGVAMSALTLTIALYSIWMNVHSDAGVFEFLVSIAAVIAFANLVLLVPLTDSQKWLRAVTIAAGVVCAEVVGTRTLLGYYGLDYSFSENLAAASGIITCCGSLALLVLARMNRNLDRVPVLSEITEITVICPGCKRKQALPVGDSSCATCGLKFNIRLEEPRCPQCDYLLYMLQSDRCPECGTLIRPAPGAAVALQAPAVSS